MAERFVDEFTRDLIEAIDARLSEAQQLWHRFERRRREAPFWPERRHIGRIADDCQQEEVSPAA